MRLGSSLAFLILAFSTSGFAQDPATLANWHQLRGPLASGVAPPGDPPMKGGAPAGEGRPPPEYPRERRNPRGRELDADRLERPHLSAHGDRDRPQGRF